MSNLQKSERWLSEYSVCLTYGFTDYQPLATFGDKVPDVLGEKVPGVCGWQASPPPTGPCVQEGKLPGVTYKYISFLYSSI